MRQLSAVALLLITMTSACNAQEGRSPETSDAAGCLALLASPLRAEIERAQKSLPIHVGDWRVQTEVFKNKASVQLIPITAPTLRGGGGRYEFNCSTRELKLVEAYR